MHDAFGHDLRHRSRPIDRHPGRTDGCGDRSQSSATSFDAARRSYDDRCDPLQDRVVSVVRGDGRLVSLRREVSVRARRLGAALGRSSSSLQDSAVPDLPHSRLLRLRSSLPLHSQRRRASALCYRHQPREKLLCYELTWCNGQTSVHPSVRLYVCPVGTYSTWLTRGQHATQPAYILAWRGVFITANFRGPDRAPGLMSTCVCPDNFRTKWLLT